MDFKGPARALSSGDVEVIAGYLGCYVASVRAVVAVESEGKGFRNWRPLILNEPHVFWRELGAGEKRARAVKAGLAYRKWRTKPYPKTQDGRYAWLDQAMKIDEAAALRSCSWGLGQMMGFNHAACGFADVRSFVQAMTVSEGAQLYAMARFIVSKGLQHHMRSRNWAKFAHGYNGSGYKKNRYDARLAEAWAARPRSERVTPPPATEAQLKALLSAEPERTDIDGKTGAGGAVIVGVAATQWWQEPWFWVAAGLAVAALLAIVFRRRIRAWLNRKE